MERNSIPSQNPNSILEILNGFRRSQTLFAAIELGIFDELKRNGPSSLKHLETQLKLHSDGMERLLYACVGLQLISKKV